MSAVFFIAMTLHANFYFKINRSHVYNHKSKFHTAGRHYEDQHTYIRARVLRHWRDTMHHKSPCSCAFQTRAQESTGQFRHVHADGHSDAMLNTIKSYLGSCQWRPSHRYDTPATARHTAPLARLLLCYAKPDPHGYQALMAPDSR